MKHMNLKFIVVILIIGLILPPMTFAVDEQKVYSLDEIVTRGLERSPKIRSAQYQIDSVEITRDRANLNLNFIPAAQFFSSPAPMIQYRQAVALDRAYDSARDNLQIEIDKQRYSLIEKYHGLYNAQKAMEVAKLERSYQDSQYKIAMLRGRMGLSSSIEEQAAKKSFESARATFSLKSAELDKAYQNLNAVLGFLPEYRYQLEFNQMADIDTTLLDSDLTRLISMNRDGLLIRIMERSLAQKQFEYNFYVFNEPGAKPLDAVGKDINAEEANIADMRNTLAQATRNLFFSAQQIQKNYKDLMMKHETDQKMHEIRVKQYELGMITKMDLMQSEMTLLENEATLAQLQNSFNEIIFTLNYPHAR